MKRLVGIFLLAMILLLMVYGLPGGARAASVFDWQVYESENFVIFYHKGYEYQAQETAYFLEKYLPRVKELSGNHRDFKTRIIIQDVGIDSNGYADNIGNKISIYTNSPSAGDTLAGMQSWFRLVGGHELTHIRHLNNYSDAGGIMPFIFGDQLSPNMLVPGWIIEGITVYNESQLSPYEGRLNDGYADAMIASKAAAGKFPDILGANYVYSSYPMAQYYEFGGAFTRYLATTYGEESLTKFFDTHGKNPVAALGVFVPSIGVDLAAKKVFGKDFLALYRDWQRAEEAEHKDWKVDGEAISAARLGFISHLNAANGKLYFVKVHILSPAPFMFYGLPELVEYDPTKETERVLKTLSGAIPTSLQVVGNQLYYTLMETKGGYANVDQLGFGATGTLYSYDLTTGQTRKYFSDELKAFLVLENGDILYAKERRDGHGSEIYKFIQGEKVLQGKVDHLISEIVQYGDKYLTVSKLNYGSWNIYTMNEKMEFTPIIDTPWAETGIYLDGDNLYYAANYNSHHAIYRYSLTTGSVEQLTTGGYATDGQPIQGNLYFKGLAHDGEKVFKTAVEAHPYQLGASEAVHVEPVQEFAETLQSGDSLTKNLTYLLKPQFRVFPWLWNSEDGLGYTNFQIDYLSGGLSFGVTTTVAAPLQVSLYNRGSIFGRRSTSIELSYPIYKASKYGISGLDLGFVGSMPEMNYLVNARVGLRAPRQMGSVNVSTLPKTKGVKGSLGYLYMFNQSSIKVNASAFYQYPETPVLRGIKVAAAGNGIALSTDYTFKLAEVRKGFWYSTLYLADLYGDIFMDYTNLDGGKVSYGAMLSGEMGMGFWAPVVPTVGFAVSDGTITALVGFGM